MEPNDQDIQIVNCHTHIFTNEFVPNRFFYLPLIPLFHKAAIARPIGRFLEWILPSGNDFFDRAAKLIAIGAHETQTEVFEILRSHYPENTKFVLLSMDMEFMGAGKPKRSYLTQLEELKHIKQSFPESAYPFVCVDPRREGIGAIVRECIEDWGFSGIKIYPPLGYFPFPFPYEVDGKAKGTFHEPMSREDRLREIFAFAENNKIPVISHCTPGGVHGRLQEYTAHPVTGRSMPSRQKQSRYIYNFIHPSNFQYLLEQFPNLKLCLAHFGGHDDWKQHLSVPIQAVTPHTVSSRAKAKISEVGNQFYDPVWNPTIQEVEENSWVSVIRSLLKDKRYPNLYADVSFNAFTPDTLAYLKLLLNDTRFNERILFGTDFHVVRLKKSEKEFSIGMRGYLGEERFRLIAEENPKSFLNL